MQTVCLYQDYQWIRWHEIFRVTVFGFTNVITVSLFTYLYMNSFHTEWFSIIDPLPPLSFPHSFWTTPSGGFLSKIPIFEENKMKKNEQPWQIMTKGDWDWLCALTGCRKEDWNFRKILGCTLGPRIIRFLVLRKKLYYPNFANLH